MKIRAPYFIDAYFLTEKDLIFYTNLNFKMLLIQFKVYKLLEPFFPLSYDFGIVYISLAYELYAPHISPLIC